MNTTSYHVSNFGALSPAGVAMDNMGYVTIHNHPRYAVATIDQLHEWSESRLRYVRDAALTELAERRVAEWRRKSII